MLVKYTSASTTKALRLKLVDLLKQYEAQITKACMTWNGKSCYVYFECTPTTFKLMYPILEEVMNVN